jgi:hypothetical protein
LVPLLLLFAGTTLAGEPPKTGTDWWSLRKIAKPELPEVKRANWVNNPIDSFVLAGLEANNLDPAPRADPVTLIRRVHFDLIGLPPTSEEIDAFLEEYARQPRKAYEKLVDSQLASPQYGERWGRHWLDTVRFAESHGFEYDRLRDNAWRYRDYVIQSLNADKPYATFVKEQLAGDVLPPVTKEGIVATGFLVAGPWDQAGSGSASALVRAKVREDELEDMLGAVGQTFLGLTINCARCHDHKFDPVPIRDYYRLKAAFDGVYHGERQLLTPEEIGARQNQMSSHQAKIDAVQRKLNELENRGRARFHAARGKEDFQNLPRPSSRWTFENDARDQIGTLHGTLKGGAALIGGQLVLNGKEAFVETAVLDHDLREKTLEAWVALPNLDQGGGGVISVETNDGSVFDAIVFGERQRGKWIAGSGGFQRTRDLSAPAENAKPDDLVHVAVVYSADGGIAVYRNGELYGERYFPLGANGRLQTYKAGTSHILFGKRHTGGGSAYLTGAIAEARLYDRALAAAEVQSSFKAGVERISQQQLREALHETERREYAELELKLAKLRSALPGPLPSTLAFAASIRPPGPTYLLNRGDPESKGEIVTAGPPSEIKGPFSDFGLQSDSPEGQRRLKFAEWTTDRENPLTWRVMANRVWQHHFGEGIVRTPNDFGINGDKPTHPELLDWLAVTLRDQGGSLKKLHRLILLSATYQQSSKLSPKAFAGDSENRLLWRFAPQRLEAEAVRDAMLAVSGNLNPQAGGPAFRPFKIETFNSAFYLLIDADNPQFNRRSVYRINVNSAKDPLLDVLDCPDPSVKTPKRATTITPLQALTLMNNSFIQRQARAFSERVRAANGDDIAKQVNSVYRMALGREPTKSESDRAIGLVKENGLQPLCWAVFNSSEFVYIR